MAESDTTEKVSLVFISDYDDPATWKTALADAWPDLDVHIWPDVPDPAAIDFALVWKPPQGVLKTFQNLKLIINLGAGIDTIIADQTLPPEVPIARLIDQGQIDMMAQYVAMAVLRHHKNLHAFERNRRSRTWEYIHPTETRDCRVGVMGLGHIGKVSAKTLQAMGFDVAGWSRSGRPVDDIEVFGGKEGLGQFLKDLDILVAMLPGTPETNGLIDKAFIEQLPSGVKFVNVGRGSTVVEADLIAALTTGHIAEATLDVFEQEPLAPDHPLWNFEQVLITPHLAACTVPRTAAVNVVANCRRVLAGDAPENVIDINRGY